MVQARLWNIIFAYQHGHRGLGGGWHLLEDPKIRHLQRGSNRKNALTANFHNNFWPDTPWLPRSYPLGVWARPRLSTATLIRMSNFLWPSRVRPFLMYENASKLRKLCLRIFPEPWKAVHILSIFHYFRTPIPLSPDWNYIIFILLQNNQLCVLSPLVISFI